MLNNLHYPAMLNTSHNNLIDEFFIPSLINSVKYDRGVGYFSSGWLRMSAKGMSHFAENSGHARWVTSPILNKQDWDALLQGTEAKQDEIVLKIIRENIFDLEKSLEQDTLSAIAWMVADNIIDFKLALPRNKLKDGEFHDKFGIFTDNANNKVVFNGSYNDSIHGLQNYESIKVFCSWNEYAKPWIVGEDERFENLWNNSDPNVRVYDLGQAAKKQILELRNEERPYSQKVFPISGIDSILNPHIPTKVVLRDYQEEALDKWKENNYLGVLEMATGTGKTITALTGTTRLLDERNRLFIIIVCPYIHLAQQWVEEAEKFSFKPILIAEARQNWAEILNKAARDFREQYVKNVVAITTNTSFLKSDFLEILRANNVLEKSLIVADEMHHCGSKEMLDRLPNEIPYRLGLSATPVRNYDETGSEKLLEYFGKIIFKFGLKQAIEAGFLTRYFYYPIPVYMQDDEFDEYLAITQKLKRMHPNPEQPMSEAALLLAIKRSRVLNNSRSKVEWLRNSISNENEFKHTLFYVGDQIFSDVLRLLGYEKEIIVHEFTHRQSLDERKKLLQDFSNGKIHAFVAMKCLDEGVDVPPTRTAYFLASSSVEREFIQRRGRILRNSPGKSEAIIYDLISVPPKEYLALGKNQEDFSTVRSAIRREYKRIAEFASLAENRYQALGKFRELANIFDLLDI